MSILHTVNKSPFQHSTLQQCLDIITNEHALLLIEDGVYGALQSNPMQSELSQLKGRKIALYALEQDLKARGLNDNLIEDVTSISMADFVELCCQHKSTQSWY